MGRSDRACELQDAAPGADGHVIEQQDCMDIRVGSGSERVGREGNFPFERRAGGIGRKAG
jgi:hypothetical protein